MSTLRFKRGVYYYFKKKKGLHRYYRNFDFGIGKVSYHKNGAIYLHADDSFICDGWGQIVRPYLSLTKSNKCILISGHYDIMEANKRTVNRYEKKFLVQELCK